MTTIIPGGQSQPRQVSNFFVRTVTALVLLPVVLLAIIIGGWLVTLLVGLLALIGLLEFYLFAQGRQSQGSTLIAMPAGIAVILAFHFHSSALGIAALILAALLTFGLEWLRHPGAARQTLWQVGTTLGGILYIAFPLGFLVAVRGIEPEPVGLIWLLAICFVTWGTDSFAYLGGRFFGRTKLAPVLSPKKTVEGAVAGVIGGIIPAAGLLALTGHLTLGSFILMCVCPFAAISGDLFESALKRYFGVKDSHVSGLNIFPGHGGVLDRIDSLIWVSTLCYGYLALAGIVVW